MAFRIINVRKHFVTLENRCKNRFFFRHITLENEPNCLSYDTKWANERNKKES